jgi:RNA polymerase sigma-70 factor (ECF subfamily)
LEHSVDSAFRLANVILGPTGDADDATQDAIERAWRSRHSLRDPQSFDAWFQRIVVNSCRDRIRRTKASPVFIVVEHDDRPAGGADIATSAAQRDAVRAALDRLNSDQRIAIVLRYFLDLEVDEIARRTGTRPGTVKSRLHRGLEQLRDVWELEQ